MSGEEKPQLFYQEKSLPCIRKSEINSEVGYKHVMMYTCILKQFFSHEIYSKQYSNFVISLTLAVGSCSNMSKCATEIHVLMDVAQLMHADTQRNTLDVDLKL